VTLKEQFVQLITDLIALIKDRDHDNLTSAQRSEKRTRAYQLAETIGEQLDRTVIVDPSAEGTNAETKGRV
jgi:hypothetical protein